MSDVKNLIAFGVRTRFSADYDDKPTRVFELTVAAFSASLNETCIQEFLDKFS